MAIHRIHGKIIAAMHTPACWDTRARSLQIGLSRALNFWWRMIFSENRLPFFRIMLAGLGSVCATSDRYKSLFDGALAQDAARYLLAQSGNTVREP
jgi:hypothetical protein